MSSGAVTGLLVGLAVATCVAYLPVSTAGFVYEDASYIGPAAQPITLQTVMAPRGLTALSFRVGALARGVGAHPRVFHAQNVLLHLVAGLAVYLLARRLLAPPFALMATGLFWLHPMQTEAVAYIAGRAEIIAGTGVALALWAMAAPVLTWTHVGVALLAVVVAIGGKELGIMAIPLIGLYALLFRQGHWSWRRSLALGLAALVFVGLTLMVMQMRLVGNEYLSRAERGGFGYLAYQSAALWTLMGQVAWPNALTIDHDMEGLSRPQMVFALVSGAWTVLACWLVRHRWPVVSFGALWVVVALLPRFFVRIPEYLNEHQMYVPMIGISLAVAGTLQAVDAWARQRSRESLCVPDCSSS